MRQAVKTTCPYCGVGCGIVATPQRRRHGRDRRRSHPSRQSRPAVLEGRGAGRNDGAGRPAARPGDRRAAGRVGHGARSCRRAVPRHHPCSRSRRRRVLRLRSVADGGLLRRQQADEGLHRLGQYRYQFAPVHGLERRRPYPRLRRGHRPRQLRGSGAGRPRRLRRLQHGVVPPGAVPARARGAPAQPGAAPGGHRSAPHRDRGGGRSASAAAPRQRCCVVQRPAGASRAHQSGRYRFRDAQYARRRGGARGGASGCAEPRSCRRFLRAGDRRCRALLRLGRRHRKRRSRCIRKV